MDMNHQTSEPHGTARRFVPQAANGTSSRATLLLVEDHVSSASALSFLLRHEGYDVRVALNVAEALRLASESKVDLVISDIRLPDGDGRDLMEQLHSIYQLNGIALTGGTPDGRDLSETGFLGVLSKPIDFADLIFAVRKAIGTQPTEPSQSRMS